MNISFFGYADFIGKKEIKERLQVILNNLEKKQKIVFYFEGYGF